MKKKKNLIIPLLVTVTLSALIWGQVLGSESESEEPDSKNFSSTIWGKSLIGLYTIYVEVYGNENLLFESEGLTWTQIKREIELIFQQVGIKTAQKPRMGVPLLKVSVRIPSAELAAKLRISDTYTGPFPDTGCYNGTVTIELLDTVFLDRNQQRNCPAITYSGTSNFVIYDFRETAKLREEATKAIDRLPPQQRLENEKKLKEKDKVVDNLLKKYKDSVYDISDVKKPIRKAVNMFINDYLAANPKDSTTKTTQQTYVVPRNALIDMHTCATFFQIASEPNLPQEQKVIARKTGLELLVIQKVYLYENLGLGDEDLATRMRVLLKGMKDKKLGVFDYINFEDEVLRKDLNSSP